MNSLKSKFNIEHDFVNENDIVILNDSKHRETYKYKCPQEHPVLKGYFAIPNCPFALIAKDGSLMRINGKVINYYLTKPTTKGRGSYRITKPIISNGNGGLKSTFRHRLLMLTFSDYDFHPATKIINHINGVAGDDRLENLEWSTYSENLQHGYDNGLFDSVVIKVDCYNWKTKKRYRTNTVQEAADKTGINYGTLLNRLNRDIHVKAPDGWRFKRIEDEWVEMNDGYGGENLAIPIKVMNLATSQVKEYRSSRVASEILNVPMTTIKMFCLRKYMSPFQNYVFRYLEDEFPKYTDLQLEYFQWCGWKPKVPRGYFIPNSKVRFITFDQIQKISGFDKVKITNAVKRNKPICNLFLKRIPTQGI